MNQDKHRIGKIWKCEAKLVKSHDLFRSYQKISVSICVYLWMIFFCLFLTAQTLAPNAPGNDAQWATAGKQAVGTSASLNSKVWFTLAQGVMTEVYYPDLTTANTHLLQFVVVNPKTKKVETEQDDAIHNVKVTRPDSLSFQQINTAKSGEWKITKSYTTDIENSSILINVSVDSNNENLKFYVYYDPSLANSGMYDTAWNEGNTLLAKDNDKASALLIGKTFDDDPANSEKGREISNGFYQSNDGLNQLRKSGKLSPNSRAENGNVVQISEAIDKLWARKPSGDIKPIKRSNTLWSNNTTIVLSFGKSTDEAVKSASLSAIKGFAKCQAEYEKEWSDYVKTLRKVEPKYQAQFNMAAMILKAFEDKTNRGANIASASIPWGGALNANEVGSSGYHAVWARDLYQVATAFLALGDKDAANRALDFLLKVQQKPDGSIPQNSWLDGKPIGGSIQMDQVAFPLILAHELGRFDKETYEKHIKSAANYIVKNGPTTPQERWEEKGGYSPSTIAAEIAGLVCAAEIAKKNNDLKSANRWLKTADEWQQNVENWTVTTTGKHSKSPYYVRITQNGKPDAGEKYEINGVYGMVDERDIVDAGFLELVRLGIKSPDDKIVQNSIKVVDQIIKVKTPNGDGFYRYNFDSYGEPDNGQRWNFDGKYTGKGRLWALLSGERGQYELAYWSDVERKQKIQIDGINSMDFAISRLETMQKFSNEGLMIPEQIWDKAETPKNVDKQFIPELKFGEGTGSATPLAWSMAQFIRLAVNLQEGRNLDTPKVVYDRYVLGKKGEKNYSVQKCSIKSNDLNHYPQSVLCDDGNYYGIFNYNGSAKSVQIAGDFTEWKPIQIQKETPDSSSFRSFILKFAATARVEYKLIVDGKWITDPLNPNKVDNGVGGENSFFTMPDYKATTWDKQIKDFEPTLETIEIDSKVYKEKRQIQVFAMTLSATEPNPQPVLYFQDGGDYVKRAKALEVFQNLWTANKIKPFIMVFLNPKDRMKEYWANDDYAKFLAEEVVPAIDAKYNTIKSRDGRAVLGASLGGITAVNVGLKYPNVFSRIGGQSVSWWIDDERIVKEMEKLGAKERLKLSYYIDDGTLEGVEDSRKAVEILRRFGYEVTYIEGEAGHNWTAWRDRLADAFVALMK